jgi:peptidoglycan/LPS O-acetylase OafA/YrhL
MGVFRLVLSLMVVASHVGGMGDSPAGGSAVAAFFTISGFLMARTVSENYAGHGAARFYVNRVLRIMPPFLAVLAVTALVVWLRDGVGFLVNPVTQGRYMPVELPGSLTGFVEWNDRPFPLFSVPQVYLLPQAWSLVIEWIFYAVTPLAVVAVASRARPLVWSVAAASLALAWLARANPEWIRSVADTTWMFLGGMLAYRYAPRNIHPSAGADLLGATAAGVVVWLGLGWAGLSTATVHLLVPAFVVAWLLLGQWSTRRSDGFDRWCGNLAYGVFLGHFLGVMLMYWIAEGVFAATGHFGVFGIPDQSDRMLWTFSYVFAILTGIAIYYGVERPIESLRRRVRRTPARTATS